MSTAYRNPDDLAAAQRRVVELEAEIAAIAPPRKPRSLIIMAVISSSLAVATVIASLILVFWIRGKDKAERDKANAEAAAAAAAGTAPTTSASATTSPPPKPTVRVYTKPYSPALRAPIYRDINDDGTADIIMLLYDSAAAEDSRVRLAAIDGKNMNVIWEAGPWPFANHLSDVDLTLTEAGSYVAVTDPAGRVHSLDRKTGKKSNEFKPAEKPTPQFRVCAAPDGRPNVAVFPSLAHPHEYDLGDRKEISHSGDPNAVKIMQGWCGHHYREVPACADATSSGVCVKLNLTRSPSPNLMQKASLSFEDKDLTVTFGKDQDAAPYFVSQAANVITWQGLASVGDVAVKKNSIHTMRYSGGKVFALYENADAKVRLAGRDARTGTPLFSTTVNITANITTRELDVIDDEQLLFVRLTDSLRIYDMLGNEKRTIDQVTLDVEKND